MRHASKQSVRKFGDAVGVSFAAAPLSDLGVAVPAAVGAAAAFGLTAALQHKARRRVRQRGALQPSLLIDLAHQPIWLLSLAANVVNFVLQWTVLMHAPWCWFSRC